MDAMIFSAGLGTRLQPLTDHTPKPLVPVAGVPMLERVARRVIAAGATRVVVNTFHLADQIEAFLGERDGFGVDLRISREPTAGQETGGALRTARHHFRRNGSILLHNSDILSTVPLPDLVAAHEATGSLVTLAVLPTATERYLLSDSEGLVGYAERVSGTEKYVRDARGIVRRHDFTGIHVIRPDLLDMLPEANAFSLISLYLRLATEGWPIRIFVAEDARFIDIGTLEMLEEAEREVRAGTLE
jgi:NDP-sugar pyrophosphorylase family protein